AGRPLRPRPRRRGCQRRNGGAEGGREAHRPCSPSRASRAYGTARIPGGGRRQPHRERPSRSRNRAVVADRLYAAAHDARRPGCRRSRARRSRHAREIRAAFAQGIDMAFGTIEQAIEAIRDGKFAIVADDEDRENEGDLICAAQLITPEMVNFMIKKAGGMICLALTGDRVDALGLPLMAENRIDEYHTAYTTTIDASARFGVTTGISAQDRARTIRVAVDPDAEPGHLRHGGHVFPLRAREGGVLQRTGHTEAAVDLARLAGLRPAGVICEILNEDGTSSRRPQLEKFAAEHGIVFVTVAQLVAHRLKSERLVHRVAEARLPTEHGEWHIV